MALPHTGTFRPPQSRRAWQSDALDEYQPGYCLRGSEEMANERLLCVAVVATQSDRGGELNPSLIGQPLAE